MLDKHGISAILAAIWEGHTDCVKLMLKKVRRPGSGLRSGMAGYRCQALTLVTGGARGEVLSQITDKPEYEWPAGLPAVSDALIS